MAIPSDEKPRPQRRTQKQERVLIFVGSGFALRAAANLLRAVRRFLCVSFRTWSLCRLFLEAMKHLDGFSRGEDRNTLKLA